MIAMAIMTVAFASILVIQSSSLNTSLKSKQQNVVAMLARNAMTMTEVEISGKPFSEVATELGAQFDPPFAEYSWERKIKEVKFPNLQALFAGQGGDGQNADGASGSSDNGAAADKNNDLSTEMIGKIVTNYLSKALREVSITVKWKKGKGEQAYSVAMYWVDFDAPFQLTP